MSYLQVVIALITYAATHPKEFAELWQSIVDLWSAGQALTKKVTEQFVEATAALPRDLDIAGVGPEVLDAETRLEAEIAKLPAPRASTRAIFNFSKGNLRKIIGELMNSPIGKILLQQLLTKVAGVGS